MVVAMKQKLWCGCQQQGGGHAYALDLGSESVGHGVAPKNAMDPIEGNIFMVAAKHMD